MLIDRDPGKSVELKSHGMECIAAHFNDDRQLAALSSVAIVIYMAGKKFASIGDEYQTSMMNMYLPDQPSGFRNRHARVAACKLNRVSTVRRSRPVSAVMRVNR